MRISSANDKIREAIQVIGKKTVSISEVLDYVSDKYGTANVNGVNAQINFSCVNYQGRTASAANRQPRRAFGRNDFLYRLDFDFITLYRPADHGLWEIAEVDGKYIVRQTNGSFDGLQTNQRRPNRSASGKMQPKPPRVEKLPLGAYQKPGVKMQDIERPTLDFVSKFLARWQSSGSQGEIVKAIDRQFQQYCPQNSNLGDVILKIYSINSFYDSNCGNIKEMAQRILTLDIDNRLRENDLTLVRDIGKSLGAKSADKARQKYDSFASQYCSHHMPEAYPILDLATVKYLSKLLQYDSFSSFQKEDLSDITVLKNVLLDFQKYYSLESFSFADVSRFVWAYAWKLGMR